MTEPSPEPEPDVEGAAAAGPGAETPASVVSPAAKPASSRHVVRRIRSTVAVLLAVYGLICGVAWVSSALHR